MFFSRKAVILLAVSIARCTSWFVLPGMEVVTKYVVDSQGSNNSWKCSSFGEHRSWITTCQPYIEIVRTKNNIRVGCLEKYNLRAISGEGVGKLTCFNGKMLDTFIDRSLSSGFVRQGRGTITYGYPVFNEDCYFERSDCYVQSKYVTSNGALNHRVMWFDGHCLSYDRHCVRPDQDRSGRKIYMYTKPLEANVGDYFTETNIYGRGPRYRNGTGLNGRSESLSRRRRRAVGTTVAGIILPDEYLFATKVTFVTDRTEQYKCGGIYSKNCVTPISWSCEKFIAEGHLNTKAHSFPPWLELIALRKMVVCWAYFVKMEYPGIKLSQMHLMIDYQLITHVGVISVSRVKDVENGFMVADVGEEANSFFRNMTLEEAHDKNLLDITTEVNFNRLILARVIELEVLTSHLHWHVGRWTNISLQEQINKIVYDVRENTRKAIQISLDIKETKRILRNDISQLTSAMTNHTVKSVESLIKGRLLTWKLHNQTTSLMNRTSIQDGSTLDTKMANLMTEIRNKADGTDVESDIGTTKEGRAASYIGGFAGIATLAGTTVAGVIYKKRNQIATKAVDIGLDNLN